MSRISDVVLDADKNMPHSRWEYMADSVIRLDFAYGAHDYFLRHMEISKCRYQAHAFGRHLVKLLRPIPETALSLNVDREGPRPNQREGGVFVIPSLDFIMSRLRWRQPLLELQQATPMTTPNAASPLPYAGWHSFGRVSQEPEYIEWPVLGAYELAGGEIPRSGCVALMGSRGPGRGAFAYKFLLQGAALGESTLILSLRDDEHNVRKTLDRIAGLPDVAASEGLSRNPPRVLFQRPGFVTPEEVFHRVMTAVGQDGTRRLVVNAIDGWEATYPLLSESPTFIPALLDFLEVQQIAGMVVCVSSSPTGLPERALVAEARIVLRFDYSRIPWNDDILALPVGEELSAHLQESWKLSKGPQEDGFDKGTCLLRPKKEASIIAKLIVRPVRVQHARGAPRRAVLDWITMPDSNLRRTMLIPLAPEYPEELAT